MTARCPWACSTLGTNRRLALTSPSACVHYPGQDSPRSKALHSVNWVKKQKTQHKNLSQKRVSGLELHSCSLVTVRSRGAGCSAQDCACVRTVVRTWECSSISSKCPCLATSGLTTWVGKHGLQTAPRGHCGEEICVRKEPT